MPTFEDVYTIPNLAYEISSYLNVDDEMSLDRVSKAIHDTNREWVYGMYREINVDEMMEEASSVEVALKYLAKLSPYIKTLRFTGNHHELTLPRIGTMPNLQNVEFAVPLVIDLDYAVVHSTTHRIWDSVQEFITAMGTIQHKVESFRIVPGVIKILETPPDQPNAQKKVSTIDDRTPESHLRLYREYRMPTVLWPEWSKLPKVREFHVPLDLMAYVPKRLAQIEKLYCTDWQCGTTGVMYLASKLYNR